MTNLWTVTKNELKRYFISPTAYVYLISFLILNGSFAIYFGHFFDRGRADLLPMFSFQPWLYLLFISGISMRLWAEEFRAQTIIQIMTMPISTSSLVWGKFFASWIFCTIGLLLTFPFWITVNLLGNPDNNVIILSYFGSFLLAGSMIAISQTMSSLTKNQVIALVLSVIANLLFFLSSLEYVLSFFRLFAPLSVIDMVASFSFLSHFETITRGLIELRDIIFFTSIIILFNFTTEIIISFRTSGNSKILHSSSPQKGFIIFIILLTGFCGINLLANSFLRNIQYDATEEKTFSLTPSTKKILQNLSHDVNVKLYYSKILEQRNPEFRPYFDRLRLLLEQYRKIAKGKFSYSIFYPEPMSREEDYALSAGLRPLPLVDKSQSAIFGAIINDSINNKKNIPFFALERQDFIEQDLTENIFLLNNNKKKLGLITSLPMTGAAIENVMTPRWEIVKQLDKFYTIHNITNAEQFAQHNFDVLMIVHPTELSQDLTQSIINYGKQGGKILLFTDIASEAIRNYAPSALKFKASDLNGLDKAFGFHYYPQVVVADLENSLIVNASSDYRKNTIFTQDVIQFLLKDKNFNPIDSITNRLHKILFSSATVIEPDPSQETNVEFTPLITAGTKSAIMNAELVRDNINPADILRYFNTDNYHKIIAARLTSKLPDNKFDIIVVGDTDMLYDISWGKQLNITGSDYFIPLLDNANFVLNALESIIGTNELSQLRGSTGKIRTFDNIEQIRKDGLHNFQIKEQEILDNIEKAKSALNEIWNKKAFEQRINFTPDELALIAGIRKKLDTLREELRHTRAQTDAEIRQIDTLVKFFNIYAIPLLILLSLGIYLWLHHHSAPRHSSPKEKISSPILVTGFISVSLLILGLLSSHLIAQSTSQEFMDTPVFPDLPQNINKVQKIALKGHKQELIFIRKNGIWELENNQYPVLQDRIRSFLSALLEATYFEKKSAEAQYLPRFGLTPLEQNDSTAIEIKLQTENNQTLENFIIGDYDIDIGRGSRSAYIHFANKFQVWQIAADFIDLSMNPADWTYSNLWNLRFGRFISINNNTDTSFLVDVIRRMLNTQIIGISTQKPQKELFSFTLLSEGNNEVEIKGWQTQNKYFISYHFKHIPNENRLQLFEKYTNNKFCEISLSDMEKLKYALRETY